MIFFYLPALIRQDRRTHERAIDVNCNFIFHQHLKKDICKNIMPEWAYSVLLFRISKNTAMI